MSIDPRPRAHGRGERLLLDFKPPWAGAKRAWPQSGRRYCPFDFVVSRSLEDSSPVLPNRSAGTGLVRLPNFLLNGFFAGWLRNSFRSSCFFGVEYPMAFPFDGSKSGWRGSASPIRSSRLCYRGHRAPFAHPIASTRLPVSGRRLTLLHLAELLRGVAAFLSSRLLVQCSIAKAYEKLPPRQPCTRRGVRGLGTGRVTFDRFVDAEFSLPFRSRRGVAQVARVGGAWGPIPPGTQLRPTYLRP